MSRNRNRKRSDIAISSGSPIVIMSVLHQPSFLDLSLSPGIFLTSHRSPHIDGRANSSMMNPPSLCVACSSPPSTSTQTLDLLTEKPLPPPLYYSSCSHFLCHHCVGRNSRLTQYCLKCEDVGELLGGERKKTRGAVATGSNGSRAADASGSSKNVALPGYEEYPADGADDLDDELEGGEGGNALPAYNERSVLPVRAAGDVKGGATRAECGIHYLRPEETLLGLAFKYRLDVSGVSFFCFGMRLPSQY